MLASNDDNAITDEELLTGTGSGGVFASGYLRDQPLIEYLGESERVSFLLSNKKKGVRRESDDDTTAYTPGDGYQAIAAVTDTRVLFVVGDCDDDGDEMFGVPYTEIENVKTNRGVLKKSVDVWTTSGVRWRFYVRSSVDIGPATEYLERAAVVWSRVENQLQHARKHIAAISEYTTDDDHEQAREAVTTARSYVEEAQRKASELTEDHEDAIWDRIQMTERRLDEGLLNIHVSRAEHNVAAAERQWHREHYNDAYDSFLAARNQYELALDVARDQNLPAADDIRAQADEVTQSIDQLSKSPLQRAEQTHKRATMAEGPESRVDLLEDALEKYQSALVLDWGSEEQRFAGDTEELQAKIEDIVGELVDAHRELAEKRWRAGNWYRESQRYEVARTEYVQARDHLDDALAIAEELKPELEPALSSDVRALETELTEVEGTAEQATDEESGPAATERGDRSDERTLDEFVARLWTESGWETTRQQEGVVDVVATTDEPVPEKHLLVTDRRASAAQCARGAIEEAVAVRDADGDADVVTVVTSGSFSEDARSLAREENVKLVDGDRLDELLDAAGVSRQADPETQSRAD